MIRLGRGLNTILQTSNNSYQNSRFPPLHCRHYKLPPPFQFSGGGVEHPLQITVHPQDVALGEEHVHSGDAQDLAHEEASIRPKVSVSTHSLRL